MPVTVKPPAEETAWQDSTATVQITITQEDKVTAIPGASLDTCAYTLYDKLTKAVINSRTAVDVKADVDSGGILTLNLTIADNAMISTNKALKTECHIIQITWTATIGGILKSLTADFLLEVERKFTP